MIADLQFRLTTLAARVEAGMDLDDTARALRELADQHPVVLPEIRPERADLLHWQLLADERLRSENAADGWNLAAGLYVERERKARRLAEAEQQAAVEPTTAIDARSGP